MARSNAKRLSYAEQHAEEFSEGKVLEDPVVADDDLNALDKAGVQEKILNPPTIDVTLTSGKVIGCKTKFGPADYKKRQVMDVLGNLTKLLLLQAGKCSGEPEFQTEGWFERNNAYLVIATERLNVQMACVECINALGNTGIILDDIEPQQLTNAALRFFTLYSQEIISQREVVKNSKNALPKKAKVSD
jgi:hypothetical protein